MLYDEKVMFTEKVISSALLKINQLSLFENEDFEPLKGKIHSKDYVVLQLTNPNTIELLFWLECGDLRIDIDRTNETFVYDYDSVVSDRAEIVNLITMIFTSNIKVEYCGEHYTNLYFMNQDGKVLDSLRYRDALFAFRKKCVEKIYPPIYP
ncbi:MAG: hypothetical protein K0U38_05230 [Epsilonproteobacteria bacterium]|nr:hypothetical protein [Campylobacterota bacterium]